MMKSKGLYPHIEFPRELDICLSNQCNLNCAYCYFSGKKRSHPDWLGIGQIERLLDLYLSRIKASRIQKISLSGGEPLLNFGLLINAVRLIRKRAGERVKIEVFTNGTLLSSDKARQLLGENTDLVVSIDGDKEVNDLNRRFWAAPEDSVFDAVISNLRKLAPGQIERMYAGATFNASTIDRLGDSVRFLLSLGFKCVIVDFDVLAIWKPQDVEKLKEGVLEIKRIYAASLENGFGEAKAKVRFDFIIPRTELAEVINPPGLREFSVAPDGSFYPSGLVSAHGPEKVRYRVGDLDSGFDCGKMNAVLQEVRNYFSNNRMRGYNGCPTHVYFDCRLKGIDPAVVFKGGERLFECLDKIVSPVVDFELLLNRLCSNKEIGDFGHRPRYAPGREIKRLGIEFKNHEPNIGQARDGVDLLLYSPGKQKMLFLSSSDPYQDFSVVEALSAYAMMKARHLAKRIKIAVSASPVSIGRLNNGFPGEHGMSLCFTSDALLNGDNLRSVRDAVGLENVEAVIVFAPRNCAGMREIFRDLVSKGISHISLQPGQRALRRRWSDGDLDILQKEISGIAEYLCRRIEQGENIFLGNLDEFFRSSASGAGTAPLVPQVSRAPRAIPGAGASGFGAMPQGERGNKRVFENMLTLCADGCYYLRRYESGMILMQNKGIKAGTVQRGLCESGQCSVETGEAVLPKENQKVAALIDKSLLDLMSSMLDRSASDPRYRDYLCHHAGKLEDYSDLFKICAIQQTDSRAVSIR